MDPTELAIGLWLKYNNIYNMELNEHGKNKNDTENVLFKDFVKQHLKRENELENEIRALKERLKSISSPAQDKLYNMFCDMRNYMRVSLDERGFRLSVDDYPLSNEDAEFVERQIRLADEQMYSNLAPHMSEKLIETTTQPSTWSFRTALNKQYPIWKGVWDDYKWK